MQLPEEQFKINPTTTGDIVSRISKYPGHIHPPSGAVAYAIMTSFNGATTFNSTSLIHLKLNQSGTPSDTIFRVALDEPLVRATIQWTEQEVMTFPFCLSFYCRRSTVTTVCPWVKPFCFRRLVIRTTTLSLCVELFLVINEDLIVWKMRRAWCWPLTLRGALFWCFHATLSSLMTVILLFHCAASESEGDKRCYSEYCIWGSTALIEFQVSSEWGRLS